MARRRTSPFWVPVVVLGFVRQWVEYGVASAIILAIAAVPFVAVILRWSGREERVSGWRMMALLFAFAAVVELASAPFAHTSTHGVAEVGSRRVALQAGIAAAIAAVGCWLIARVRGSRRGAN